MHDNLLIKFTSSTIDIKDVAGYFRGSDMKDENEILIFSDLV